MVTSHDEPEVNEELRRHCTLPLWIQFLLVVNHNLHIYVSLVVLPYYFKNWYTFNSNLLIIQSTLLCRGLVKLGYAHKEKTDFSKPRNENNTVLRRVARYLHVWRTKRRQHQCRARMHAALRLTVRKVARSWKNIKCRKCRAEQWKDSKQLPIGCRVREDKVCFAELLFWEQIHIWVVSIDTALHLSPTS